VDYVDAAKVSISKKRDAALRMTSAQKKATELEAEM
jgi:hypothetical protein